jgi:hypothetical protein
MTNRSLGIWAGLGGLLLCLGAMAAESSYGPRQYYGNYSYNSAGKYYYRPYYYKPTPEYSGYKHHYTVYYPSKPKYQYYYNPYKKQYWGRCPTQHYGKPQYSMLAEDDRKGSVEDIPEKSFPPLANKMPPIPESEDENATMELPPDDVPTTAGSSKSLPKR